MAYVTGLQIWLKCVFVKRGALLRSGSVCGLHQQLPLYVCFLFFQVIESQREQSAARTADVEHKHTHIDLPKKKKDFSHNESLQILVLFFFF